LYTQNASQILPQLFLGKSQAEEAAWIAQGIKKLTEKGFRYKEITILYRAHYISRSIEEALRKEQIPYTIYSGVSFFERKEIKDALSYLRMIAFQDDLSFLRIVNEPKRNIGLRRIADLQQKAAEKNISLYTALGQSLEEELYKNTKAKAFVNLIEKFKKEYAEKSISSLLGEILDQSGYEKMLRTQGAQDRLDNLAELKQAVHEYEISCGEEAHLADYLNHVALYSGSDLDMSKESVKMMTIHTAKGLEFEIVFLAGMSEGMFPARKVQSLQAMEEERRLAYVAMTRAKQRLYISNGAGKNFDGSFRYPSRFVLDIDEDKVHYLRPLSDELKQTASSYIENHAQMLEEEQKPAPYKAGDVVMHPAFGKGVVMDVDLKKRIALIAFESLSTERKISFRAKMEIIGQNELKGNLN
jgi:DNA helicase-2/ATP-dependent DNA helicase PcrA